MDFTPESASFLFWLGLFCMVAAVVIIRSILRHRQRMAMIEKGIVPEAKTPQAHLRRGILMCFIGGSIMVIVFAVVILLRTFSVPVVLLYFLLAITVAFVYLGIGIAELIYYRISRPKPAVPEPPLGHLRRGLILCFIGGGLFVGITASCEGFLGAMLLSKLGVALLVVSVYVASLACLGIGIAELIYYRVTRPKPAVPKPPLGDLRWGLILSFVGGGILVFYGIGVPTGLTTTNEAIILGAGILLVIGIAELIYYRLTRNKAAPPIDKETAELQGSGEGQESGG